MPTEEEIDIVLLDAALSVNLMFPLTSNFSTGFTFPIPTNPSFVTTKLVAVDDPITNAGADPFALVGLIDSCAHGVDDARPTLPVKLFVPENVFESVSSVDEANDQVEVEKL